MLETITILFLAAPTARTFDLKQPTQSVESNSAIVDDWFDPPPDTSRVEQMLSWTTDEITPQPTSINPFHQNLFQPMQ